MTSFKQGERVVARFVLIERLGGSGTREVWRALDESDGTQVAVKLLRIVDTRASTDGAVGELEREHAIARRLHVAVPGIRVPRIDPPLQDHDVAALPMQLAVGDARSLRSKPCSRIVPVLIDVAEALRDCHAQGVIHRDLKPANVLLDFHGRALLSDFGIAAVDGVAPANAPHSPLTSAPQQVRGASPSVADDVFGFGALALELLTGYPPNFPSADIDTAAIRDPHAVPDALHALIRSSLASDVNDRPRTMAEILTVLRALDFTGVDVDASVLLERIVPTTASDTPVPDGASRRPSLSIGIVAILLVAALAAVFLWLPRLAVVTNVAASEPRGGVTPETAQALLAAQREDAARRQYATAKAEFRKALDALELRGAAQWSGAEFAAAKTLGESADTAEREGRREVALDRLQTASARLGRIGERARAALQERLETGTRALNESRLEEARAAFGLAVQIDPGNAVAMKALARVVRLEPVVARLAEADSALLEAEPLRALQLFEQVLRADGENTLAREGAARARSAIGSDRYAREIGQALEELRKGDGQRAREAYARAKNFRPDGIEIREGLIQVDALDARRDLDAVRRGAVALESNERWAEALATYESLVARDASLVFAREGAARARPRAELARRLDSLVNNAARLAAPEVRAEAESLIARATAIPGEAPRLRAQVVALRTQLQRYDTPVKLVIQSDGATQVTIQKFRALGRVTQTELELKPGRYVLVGTRDGYRDVRREILLKPGEAAPVVELHCSEAIS
mgnify:FL=1